MSYIVNVIRSTGIQRIYFNVTEVPSNPTDIWAASWLNVDDAATTWPAAESMGNVNVYTYVKPLVNILDCTETGSWKLSGATAFIEGSACGSLTRINAIVDKLKELPEGKRAYRLYRYDQATFYDEVGDRFPATTSQSPWAENAGITLNSDALIIFNKLGACGATPDYLVLDNEFQSDFSYKFGSNPTGYTGKVYGITSSALYTQSWYGITSWQGIFTKDGTYNFTGTSIVTSDYHPQTNREYLFWDRAVYAHHAKFITKFIYEPIKTLFPSVKFSNYGNAIIADEGELGNAYDINGHPIVREGIAGDGVSPEIYAGWNAPTVYGVYDSDTTRIVRTNYGSTTPFYSNSWNHFLLMIQMIRAVKRGSLNTPLRPWIASPYFADPGAGYDSKWQDSAEALGLYYELIRHFALTDVEMFLYFNGGASEDTDTKLNTALTKLNSVLQEVNLVKGGYQSNKCITTNRIDFLSDYIISGAGTTKGTYIWRVTPKPGVELEVTNTRYFLETDSDGGAWIETETSTPPGLTLSLGSQYAALRETDITRRYYYYMFIGNSTNTASYEWDGWNYDSKASFMGKPHPSGTIARSTRAYPFEYDPVDPATSSPWHNIIFERFSESYHAGMRAVSIHFPWGSAFADKSWTLQPLDQLYGTTGFTFIYPRAGLCGYLNGYNSTTEPEWSQARIKGFTGAVKQLLQGQLSPAGRTGITQSCDVFLYIPGMNGWDSYRNFLHEWWTRSAGTSAERDTALNARIDQMVDFICSMKPTTATGGLFSVGIDVGSLSPTPDSLSLWRSLVDYKSDACELANWNFRTKLENNGIHVLTEARGSTQFNRATVTSNTTGYFGSYGTTAPSGNKDVVGDESYFWFSDPDLAAIKGDNYFRNNSYAKNTNLANTHRLSGSVITLGSRLPWNLSTTVSYAGSTMELFYVMYGDPSGTNHWTVSPVYTPYYVATHLYGCADVYTDYLSRTATYANEIWGERRKYKGFSTYALDPYITFAGWPLFYQGQSAGDNGTTLSFDYRWWSPASVPTVNTMPLFYGYGFTTSAATKTGVGYPTTNYTAGFWTDSSGSFSDTKSWYINNIRGTAITFGGMLSIFKKLATEANPTGAPNPPYYLGGGPEPSPYPIWGTNDTYWVNLVDPLLR